MKRKQLTSRVRDKSLAYQEEASNLFVFSDPPKERKKLAAALVSAKRSLLIDPANYETLTLVGDIYSAIGDKQSARQALQYYDRAIALKPNLADAYSGKADLLMFQFDLPDDAERLARKALALSRINHEEGELLELRYITLLGILESRGKHNAARWLIRQALRNNPSDTMKGICENTLKRMRK